MASEKSSLLSRENVSNTTPYGASSEDIEDGQATYVTVHPIGPDDIPPPYNPSPRDLPMIICKVCGFMIDITGRHDQHVVQCSSCNEATPIKSAPPGKKYVRCPCQYLLICKSSLQRISCPRNNCKRILTLGPLPVNQFNRRVPGVCQVSCAHCHTLFLNNTLTNALAQCPHCRKKSSVGKQFVRCRAIFFVVAALVFLLLALSITMGLAFTNLSIPLFPIWIGIAVGCFFKFLLLFGIAIYYFTIKVSKIEDPI